MYNVWLRANAVLALGLFALMAIGGLHMALHAAFAEDQPLPGAGVTALGVERFRRNGEAGVDQALVRFDVRGDFRALFDWNVKQLFFFVVASYESPVARLGAANRRRQRNEITIWDHICESREDAVLDLAGAGNEYVLADLEMNLRGANVTLSLHWDVTPMVGFITKSYVADGTSSLTFPEHDLPME